MSAPAALMMMLNSGFCRKMFTTDATIRPIRAMIRNEPMPVRFFLVV